MKFTQYFLYRRQFEGRNHIKDEWIQYVVEQPCMKVRQLDGRIKKWAFIKEEDKYLRVILLEDGETVHNAFFDRNFKED